jgi:MFS family permease
LFGASALSAGFSGVELPTRNAAMPTLLPPELLSAANALLQVLFQTSIVVGPALAGLLLGTAGASVVYLVDAATFAVAVVSVLLIRPLPPEGGGTRAGLRSIAEGLRFVRGHRLLIGTFVIDIDAMVFGMPRALFPALAAGFYHVGPLGLGLLYAAPGAGALIGAVTTGWVSRVERQGRAVLLAVAAWGLAITGFGLVPSIWLALVFLAAAGAADVVSAVFRNTILQQAVPDRLRGRLSAAHIAVVTGGPRVGDFESGAVASLTTPRFSAVSGGLACLAGVGVLARLLPELDRYCRSTASTVTEEGSSGPPTDPGGPAVPIPPDVPPREGPAGRATG